MFYRTIVGALLALGALSWGGTASAKPHAMRDRAAVVHEHHTRAATSTPRSHPGRTPTDRVPKEVHQHNPGPICGRPNGPCE